MRLRADEKGYGSICACAPREREVRTEEKRRNWYTFARREQRIRNGHARSAEEKQQEWDMWRTENKEWDPYALIRLSIPEDKVKG